MGSDVFANGMEISSKASGNKSVAAMPDVCLSPPSPPAGPIPIPYPNTGMASNTTSGSKTVKIKGQEVGLKNKSKYSKSDGNQPATNSFGGGVISHKITGSVYFSAWSFDVEVEGSNVTRFGDLTTGNHMSSPAAGNGALTTSLATAIAAMDDNNPCKGLQAANAEARTAKPRRKRQKRKQHKGMSEALDPNNNHTLTHAVYTPAGGSPRIMRASSTQAPELYDSSFSKYPGKMSGASAMNKKGGCGPHNYAENKACPNTCHTEARIIEEIFSGKNTGKGGSLLLAIDWPNPPVGTSPSDPCQECVKLVCAAAKSNCMTIEKCDEDGQPKPACPDN